MCVCGPEVWRGRAAIGVHEVDERASVMYGIPQLVWCEVHI